MVFMPQFFRDWMAFGGVCVVLVVFGFVKHAYYIIKNVWAMRYAFAKPTRVLPSLGPVTINGLVSSIDDQCPVRITIREDDKEGKGTIFWEQASRIVEAHPFALLLPEAGARIIVEPEAEIHMRAAARLTDWEDDPDTKQSFRYRIGTLKDGDRAILTGVLEEKREVEAQASEYRSMKGKVRYEYVLRPIPGKGLYIDSETMFDEIRTLLRWPGWVRSVGTVILVPLYIHARYPSLSINRGLVFLVLLLVYAFARISFLSFDRRPWFDRPNNPKKPYRGSEDRKFRSPFELW
jgi:hypothetical protein